MKTLRTTLLLSTAALAAIAYDAGKGGWKKAADGSLETDSDGNPIYLDADGKETMIAPGYINRLNSEAATHRQAARAAEAKLTAFGDLDPKTAKEAVEKLKDVDFDKLVNKGEVETIKQQMKDQYEKETTELNEKLNAERQRVNNLTLNNAFNSSEFLSQRVALPADVVQATFRDRFKVDDGKIIPLNGTGEPLINKHGDIASVDEAFETYISARTDKDTWLKAPDVGGSGSQGGAGGRGGGNIIKRSDFDALDPMAQAAMGVKASKGEVKIVD